MKLGATEYRMLHYWVEKMLGRPMQCSDCGTRNKRRYHWANISGKYLKDTNDWVRLCVSCHFKKDANNCSETHCLKGHEFLPENIYIRKNGLRECKECRRISRRKYEQSG